MEKHELPELRVDLACLTIEQQFDVYAHKNSKGPNLTETRDLNLTANTTKQVSGNNLYCIAK